MQTYDDERAGRLRQWIRSVYAHAAQDQSFPNVDALLFAGDLTDHGKREQVEDFWRIVREETRNETQILAVLAKNHDNWTEGRISVKDGMRFFREITGLPTSYRTVIGGCSFIGISTSEQTGVYYDESQYAWLADTLAEAARETPGKPIFVMHHEHVSDTVFGSTKTDGWGMDYFRELFAQYPQVVHLSGHSHYPINDPRSVWQDEFTAVGVGALSYAELTVDGQNKIHPPGCDAIAQGWIVELDAQNRLRLRGYDALSDTLLCEVLLDLSDPPRSFSQTSQTQISRASPPAFPPDSVPDVRHENNRITVTFPPAACEDGAPVFLYRVCVAAADKTTAHTVALPEYWRADPVTPCVTLPAPYSDYTVRVTAENAYGMQSKTIRKECYHEP